MTRKVLSLLAFSLFTLSVHAEDMAANAFVISKDVTIPERSEYKNVVVVAGEVELFGKIENLIVTGGLVKVHPGALIKNKMLVLGGTVQQLEGAKTPEGPKLSFIERWKRSSQNWINKWKHRFEDPDEDENTDWSKAFVFPFILVIPLSIVIVLFGFAILFFTVAPKISGAADEILRREPLISLAWGAVAYLFLTPFIAVLTLSIVGIPLVPLVGFFAVLFILAGFFSASRTLGGLVLSRLGIEITALDALLGIIFLYGLIFMPFIGKLLVFFILIAGTGAVLRSFFGKSHTRFDFWRNRRVYDI